MTRSSISKAALAAALMLIIFMGFSQVHQTHSSKPEPPPDNPPDNPPENPPDNPPENPPTYNPIPPPLPPPGGGGDGGGEDGGGNGGGGGGGGPPTGPVIVLVNYGSYTEGTDPPRVSDNSLMSYTLNNGVGKEGMDVYSAANMDNSKKENDLEHGPSFAPGAPDWDPFGGYQPSYYVSLDEHVSGDLTNPNTAGDAVAILKFKVTDSAGTVVFENTITATSAQGYTLADLEEQAATGVNNYLHSQLGK